MTPKQIHDLRVSLGMTLQDMADYLGLRHKSQAHHLETGRTAATGAKLKMLELLRPDHFMIHVTLPRGKRTTLRAVAARHGLPMSEFARRAVLAAVRAVEAGRVPFPDGE